MAGRDTEFQKKLKERQELERQAVILAKGEEQPVLPDPRTNIPFTATEKTLRQCYHEFTRMVIQGTPEGDIVVYKFSIIDPADRTVYHYAVRHEMLEKMIEDMIAMRDHVDEVPDAPAS